MGTTSVIHVLLPTLLTVLQRTAQKYNDLLQITVSRDVTATPSWHVPKELASQAQCKGRGEWDFSWNPSQSFQARCRTLRCSQLGIWDERSNKLKQIYSWSIYLQAMQQLGRSFQKAIYNAKSNDDKQFWALQLSILSSFSLLREVHAHKQINKPISSWNVSFKIKNSQEKYLA